MIYLQDLLFIVTYLFLKECARRCFYKRKDKFTLFRRYFYWTEYLILAFYRYDGACLSGSERRVNFAMIICTCLVFDYVVTRNRDI